MNMSNGTIRAIAVTGALVSVIAACFFYLGLDIVEGFVWQYCPRCGIAFWIISAEFLVSILYFVASVGLVIFPRSKILIWLTLAYLIILIPALIPFILTH